MATLVAYPDAGSGGTTVDGYFNTAVLNEAWATMQARVSSATVDTSGAFGEVTIASSGTSNQWARLTRNIFTFDTSPIGGLDIQSATVSLSANNKGDNFAPAIAPDIAIVAATPASNNALVVADYSQLGTTAFATITYANWPASGYVDFALNAAGLANINASGISRFGARNANYDIANSAPVWSNTTTAHLDLLLADTAGTTSDPKLTVTYGPWISGRVDYRLFPRYRLRRAN